MESTQNKIYEIEEQESKPIFKSSQIQPEELKSEDKLNFGDESPTFQFVNIKTGTNV